MNEIISPQTVGLITVAALPLLMLASVIKLGRAVRLNKRKIRELEAKLFSPGALLVGALLLIPSSPEAETIPDVIEIAEKAAQSEGFLGVLQLVLQFLIIPAFYFVIGLNKKLTEQENRLNVLEARITHHRESTVTSIEAISKNVNSTLEQINRLGDRFDRLSERLTRGS